MARTRLATWVAVSLLVPPLFAAPSAGPDPDGSDDALVERVTVIATRLADEPGAAGEIPANVTVITREQIERSGARTLQDLLALEAGVVVYDQVGNDIQKTLDLRGFTGGAGTRVFLDGAPVNDPRNNGLALELISLGALERVEITRGSSAAPAGGGAEAGVIQLVTRRGTELGGSLSFAAGTFDTTEFSGELRQATERLDLFVVGGREETDGFRDNAGGELTRATAGLGIDLGAERRLELSVTHGDSELGNPGALTASELVADPKATPFNSLDFAEDRLTQASLNYSGPLGDDLSLAANLFFTDRGGRALSTGRSAALFGGFFIDSEGADWGTTAQLSHRWQGRKRSNRLVAGVEALDGDTDAVGISTPSADPGVIDPANTVSDNTSDRRTWALFVQDSWRPTGRLSLHAGARFDRDRVGYEDRLDSTNVTDRSFSELSLRAGAGFDASPRWGVYVSYGEAFLPPTAEQMFSFPLFGSNPALEPEDSRSYEAGVRGGWGERFSLATSLFVVDTDDEIVFDPGSPLGLFGANVNAGKTRREGLEASFKARMSQRLDLFANLTLTDSEFRAGADQGNAVPLVPGERLAAGINVQLPANLALRAEGLWVGKQVLSNDSGNTQDELDAYTVVNARLGWTSKRSQSADGGLSLFAEARNLFDESYSTRGIFAIGDVFFTPAPGRRYLLGAEWTF